MLLTWIKVEVGGMERLRGDKRKVGHLETKRRVHWGKKHIHDNIYTFT